MGLPGGGGEAQASGTPRARPLLFLIYGYDENRSVRDVARLELAAPVSDELLELIDRHEGVTDRLLPHCSPQLLECLQPHLDLDAGPDGDIHIRRFEDGELLNYRIHDQRELTLMLAGKKPFATFGVSPGGSIAEATDQDFDRYVKSGQLVSKRFPINEATVAGPRKGPDWDMLTYALPSEAWRMDAYFLVFRSCCRYGFGRDNDPVFGALMGYTDEENEDYMRSRAELAAR